MDRLFQKLSLTYGKTFIEKWTGIPMEAVKAEWADKLGKFELESIKDALEHCQTNVEFPPTLPQFIQICQAKTKVPVFHKLERRFTAEEIASNRAKLKQAMAQLGRKLTVNS